MSQESSPGVVSWHVPRIITAWLVALLAALAVVLFEPVENRFEWLVVALGFSVIVSFALQLGTAQREGFITRLSFSVVGSLILIAIVELCAFLLGSR